MAEEEVEEKKSKGGLIKIILFALGGIMLVVMGLEHLPHQTRSKHLKQWNVVLTHALPHSS